MRTWETAVGNRPAVVVLCPGGGREEVGVGEGDLAGYPSQAISYPGKAQQTTCSPGAK